MPKAKVISHFVKDLIDDRSSRRKCSVRKVVLRNFTKFTGKHLRQSLFFNKVAGHRLWHRCFSVNFAKFLTTHFLQNTSDCFCIDMWQIICYLKDLRTLLKSLQFVYYSNRTLSYSNLELHSPTKSLLLDVPHKYKKALCSIRICKFFKCFYFVYISPN